MIVRQTRPTSNFTVISNSIINDPELEWQDIGLLIWILSKPDNWEIKPAHLMKLRKAGKYAIYGMLRRILDAGYGWKHPLPEGGWRWYIGETKDKEQGKRHTDKPDTENPHAENQDTLISTERAESTERAVKPERAGAAPENQQKPANPKPFEPPATVDTQAWADFDSHRCSTTKLRATWTDLAKTKSANILCQHSTEDQRKIVDHSICGGYPGLYPDSLNRGKPKGFQADDDDWRERYARGEDIMRAPGAKARIIEGEVMN